LFPVAAVGDLVQLSSHSPSVFVENRRAPSIAMHPTLPLLPLAFPSSLTPFTYCLG